MSSARRPPGRDISLLANQLDAGLDAVVSKENILGFVVEKSKVIDAKS